MLRLLTVGLTLLAAARATAHPGMIPAPTPTPSPAPLVPAANNQATDTEVAEHVAQGRRLYLLGRYQEAIAEYRRAYELRADPQFLMDTAEAYRQLGATERALFYYERYLAAAPNAPDREIVEDRITELELVKAPPPAQAPLAAEPPVVVAKPRPVWKRWWLWTAVGVAVGAGITAAVLSSRSTAPTVPTTDLGNQRF
ncbi:MAG: tetratricopeptide repeat protein [Polyangia bacterium]